MSLLDSISNMWSSLRSPAQNSKLGSVGYSTSASAPAGSAGGYTSTATVRSDSDHRDTSYDIANILGTYLTSLSTNAMEAERESARTANAFAASQAALDREFQQNSANAAMRFSADQAQLDRTWQEAQNAKAMQFSADEATRAMDFSERMSNTQYQRAVADLRKAGLNPILAYSNLNGSSPSGYAGTGYTSSGSAGVGYSSSGAHATATKANVSNAKQADLAAFDKTINTIALGLSSAVSVFRKLVG